MPRSRQIHGRRGLLLIVPLLTLVIALSLAGCSTSGGGGTNYSLGLAGSTGDHPSAPPSIPATGPGGTYAFVYDNQIWLRQNGQAQAKQLTHLVLSNGATLLWGPLIWSPSGKYIAFALVENLTPDEPTRTSGPLYYVDTTPGTHFGDTSAAGNASIYGHSYAWWDDNAIFYSSGSGVMLFDLGDCDPRVWQAITPFQNVGGTPTNYTGGNVSFSDIAITGEGNQLLATRITLPSPGNTGQVGTASIYSYLLPSLREYEASHQASRDSLCANDSTPQWLNENIQIPSANRQGSPYYGGSVLGIAYADPNGDIVTGAWQLARSGTLAWQRIDKVDTKAGTVSSTFCVDGNCGVLRGANKYPIAAHPSLGISSKGNHIAFAADKLYVDGNGAVGDAGGNASPVWGPGDVAVATQLVSQSTDAGGVLRTQTNVVISSGGKATTVMIAGAQDLSWTP
ncbi:MAG TPA: hypothetical protein VF510_08895 [Ktedonobacterales bacterium]